MDEQLLEKLLDQLVLCTTFAGRGTLYSITSRADLSNRGWAPGDRAAQIDMPPDVWTITVKPLREATEDEIRSALQ